jgi:hypothetical protein
MPRQIDDEPSDPAFPDRGQLGGDDFVMTLLHGSVVGGEEWTV